MKLKWRYLRVYPIYVSLVVFCTSFLKIRFAIIYCRWYHFTSASLIATGKK